MVIAVECVILCALFTAAVAAASLRDPLAGVHNWPPAIQARARELGLIQSDQMAGARAAREKKLLGALLAVGVCGAVVYGINGARGFAEGFGDSYLIWTVVNWYDAIVIDCLWVCHDRRLRIPGTEDMKEYQDYLFHIRASLRGQVLGLPVCALVGAVTALLPG